MKIILFSLAFFIFVPGLVFVGCSKDNDESISPTQPQNHAPQIISITANPTSIYINESTNLVCVATDYDQDSLTYSWICPFGYFPSGTLGSSVLWQAPNNESVYYVQVIVTDGALTDEDSLLVEVKLDTIKPNIPSSPYPADNDSLISLDINLSWTCNDPGGDPITYSIYFSNYSNPQLIENNWNSNIYDLWNLAYSTNYYWKIVAKDNHGNSTEGPIWQFITVGNYTPTIPSSPYPTNNDTMVAINAELSWSCSDPEGDPLSYDIYFGNISPPSMVVNNRTYNTYDPPGSLANGAIYYWKIKAKDNHGNSTEGPIWQFITVGNYTPTIPSSPYPTNNVIV